MPKIMLHDEAAREALGQRGRQARQGGARHAGAEGHERDHGPADRHADRLARRRQHRQRDRTRMPVREHGRAGLREVSKQTNEVAGDGTTTATVLADVLVQQGLECLAAGANPVELVEGLKLAVDGDHRDA